MRIRGKIRLLNRIKNCHKKGVTKSHDRYLRNREDALAYGRSCKLTVMDAVCIGLYWGEGDKFDRRWGFTNSDFTAVKMMRDWAVRMGQPEDGFYANVHVHKHDNVSDYAVRKFWSKAGVPITRVVISRINRFGTGIHKRIHVYGTCHLTVRGGKGGAWLYSCYEGQVSTVMTELGIKKPKNVNVK